LVDRLSGLGVTVLVLRDFDKAGFSIVHTLRTDSRRYTFRTKPNVIDIGLRLGDVCAWGLESLSEPVTYRGELDPRDGLRAAGATEEECEFLVKGSAYAGWSGRGLVDWLTGHYSHWAGVAITDVGRAWVDAHPEPVARQPEPRRRGRKKCVTHHEERK
jgi:hypothetical protein